MITNNFKAVLGMLLSFSGAGNSYGRIGVLPVVDVNGVTYYLTGNSATGTFNAFPYDVTLNATNNVNNSGISIGSDDTEASITDYQLGSTITSSNVTLQVTQITQGEDTNGDPYIEFRITVTNNESESLTVNEIGYKQKLLVKTYEQKSTNTSPTGHLFLFDRTVLQSSLVIPSGQSGVINYRLTTTMSST